MEIRLELMALVIIESVSEPFEWRREEDGEGLLLWPEALVAAPMGKVDPVEVVEAAAAATGIVETLEEEKEFGGRMDARW